MGFSKDRPSVDVSIVHPLPATNRASLPRGASWARWLVPPRGANRTRRHLRPGVARFRARSVLAVPPGFDGLLCTIPCRFVAPCSRPWGSPRFRRRSALLPPPARDDLPKEAPRARDPRAMCRTPPFPWRVHPSELFPRRQPRRVTAADALSPSGGLGATAPAFPEEGRAAARGNATDLKALIHRRVRCDPAAFPPEGRPMLPWASDPREDRRLRSGVLGAALAVTSHDAWTARTVARCPAGAGNARRTGRGTFPTSLTRLPVRTRTTEVAQARGPDRPPSPEGRRHATSWEAATRWRGALPACRPRDEDRCRAPRGPAAAPARGASSFPFAGGTSAWTGKPGPAGTVPLGRRAPKHSFPGTRQGLSATLPADTAEAVTRGRESWKTLDPP